MKVPGSARFFLTMEEKLIGCGIVGNLMEIPEWLRKNPGFNCIPIVHTGSN